MSWTFRNISIRPGCASTQTDKNSKMDTFSFRSYNKHINYMYINCSHRSTIKYRGLLELTSVAPCRRLRYMSLTDSAAPPKHDRIDIFVTYRQTTRLKEARTHHPLFFKIDPQCHKGNLIINRQNNKISLKNIFLLFKH